jgi:hypothetical protein
MVKYILSYLCFYILLLFLTNALLRMKKLLLMLALAAGTQWAMAQDNSEKNLVKTFDPKGATSVAFECQQKSIKTTTWDGAMMRVELVVKANMPTAVLEQLVKAGRYNIEGAVNADGEFVVSAPNAAKSVVVRGTDLVEEIYVTVQTSDKYLVSNNRMEKETPMVAARTLKDVEKIRSMKAINQEMQTAVKIQSTLKTQPALDLKYGDILIDDVPIPFE